MRWTADDDLNELIRRYYAGEAGLWEEIRQRVDDELHSRGIVTGGYHIRLRARANNSYDIQIEAADEYTNPA